MNKDTKKDRPEYGTPEFDAWVREQARKDAIEMANIEITEEDKNLEVGRMCGPENTDDLCLEKRIVEDCAR